MPHSLALIPHQIGAYTSGRPTTTGVPESWKCAGTAPLEDTIVNGCSAGYTTPDTCRCMSVAAREKHFLPQVSPIPLMREEAPQVYITTIHLFSPLFLPAAAAACLACQKRHRTQDHQTAQRVRFRAGQSSPLRRHGRWGSNHSDKRSQLRTRAARYSANQTRDITSLAKDPWQHAHEARDASFKPDSPLTAPGPASSPPCALLLAAKP